MLAQNQKHFFFYNLTSFHVVFNSELEWDVSVFQREWANIRASPAEFYISSVAVMNVYTLVERYTHVDSSAHKHMHTFVVSLNSCDLAVVLI